MAEAGDGVIVLKSLNHRIFHVLPVRHVEQQTLDAARQAAMARALRGTYPRLDRAVKRRARARDAAHREGRRVQLVIGGEDERSADELGSRLLALRQRAGQHLVNWLVAWGFARDDGGDIAQKARARRGEAAIRHVVDGGVLQCGLREEREAALDAGHAGERGGERGKPLGRAENRVFREGLDFAAAPEKGGDLLQARIAGERRRVRTAIVKPAVGDQRDRGIEHRLAEAERPRRAANLLIFLRSPALQGAHILRPVALGAAVRHWLGTDQVAAHIGVEGGERNAEFRRRLAGGKVETLRGFGHDALPFYILIILIKIDDQSMYLQLQGQRSPPRRAGRTGSEPPSC